MSQGANVEDLDVFRLLKASLLRFKHAADTAIVSGDAQVTRTLQWLEGEQLSYWAGQIRSRKEAVSRAKDAVRQKTVFKDATGRTPSAAWEEKILKAALLALEEAETRYAATKRAIPKLQKEAEVFRGTVQSLGNLLANDLPNAIAMIGRASATLEDYVNLASSTASAQSGPTPAASGESFSRGGESAPNAMPGQTPTKPEDPHVAG